MRADRQGSALLEATVALAILAFAGAGMLSVLGHTRLALRSARESERLVTRGARELERLVRFDRAQLDSMAGWTNHNGLFIHVRAVGGGLFDAEVYERENGSPLIATTLYRRDSTNVSP